MLIYHIVMPEIWEKFKNKDFFESETLESEGFIHCSFREQLESVLQRYYKDVERILILEIDSEKLKSKLIAEPSTNNEIYPHIYGEINCDAIVGIEEISPQMNTDKIN